MSQGNGKGSSKREDRDFTTTERRILEILSDGESHHVRELHTCLPDELSSLIAVNDHIVRIRKKLNKKGHDIVCIKKGYSTHYRHVRLLHSPSD